MQEPFEWNSPSESDLLSRDLQRRSALLAAGALIGLGAGMVPLLFLGLKGGVVWLGFGIVALAVLALLLRYFEAGVVAFLGVCWIALGTPTLAQGGSGGGAQRLNISEVGLIVLLALWGARRLFAWKRSVDNRLYETPLNVPILLYLLIAIWSTVNGVLFPNALVAANAPTQYVQVNILEVTMRVLALGSVLLIGNSLEGGLLKVGAVVVVLPGILTFFLHAAGQDHLVPSAFFMAFPQQLAMAILAAVALTGVWARPAVRVACGMMALLMVGWWLSKGAEWVSGWLGAVVALAIMSYAAQRKLFWTGAGLVALIVLLNFGYFYQSVYVSNFYGSGPTHDAARVGHMGTFTNDRTRMWGAAAKYAAYFPLGIGIGNFRSYESYFGRVDVWNTTVFTSAHGTYSQALAETGWLGFAAFLLLIYTAARMLRGFYRALPVGSRGRTYLLGAWAGCVGVFCSAFNGDYLFPAYHNGGLGSFGACVYVWLMIGVSVAIARQYGLRWSDVVAAQRAEREAGPAKPIVAPIYRREIQVFRVSANNLTSDAESAG